MAAGLAPQTMGEVLRIIFITLGSVTTMNFQYCLLAPVGAH
jgi:hypothetical protein